MTFEEFIAGRLNRAHVLFDDDNLKLWIRKRTMRSERFLFDIANVEATVRGTGSLTRFLDRYEALGVFVETVSDDRLGDFLLRRGYTQKESMPGASFHLSTDENALDDDGQALLEALRTYDPFACFT